MAAAVSSTKDIRRGKLESFEERLARNRIPGTNRLFRLIQKSNADEVLSDEGKIKLIFKRMRRRHSYFFFYKIRKYLFSG